MLDHERFDFTSSEENQALSNEIVKTYQDAQRQSGSVDVSGDDTWFDYYPNCQDFLYAIWRSVFRGESGVFIHEYEISQAQEIIDFDLVKKLTSYVINYSDALIISDDDESTQELINDFGVPAERIIPAP
jgi:hypothetical protein